jgi:plasminogen activator inhibitor 1 RNA-binding protein
MGRGGRGSRGGSGNFRGGNTGGEFRPRREFDRHSGSDKSSVKPMDKREGGGARNWGTYRDEIPEQTENQPETPEKPQTEGHVEETATEPKDPDAPADENAATEDNSAKVGYYFSARVVFARNDIVMFYLKI